MGAVINRPDEVDPRVHRSGKKGRVITGGGCANAGRIFLQPTVIADIGGSRLEQEKLGPLLAVTKSKNFDHALETPTTLSLA
jgi:1-pyrroline-5-carboxylate dehydrogenase